MPRIVFLNRYFLPDHSTTGQLVSDLASHLAQEGRDIHVVAGAHHDLPAAGSKVGGVVLHRVRDVPDLDRDSLHSSIGTKLAAIVSSGDIVVAMTDPPLVSVLAAHIAGSHQCKLINWLQDIYPEAMTASGVNVAGSLVLTRLRDGALKAAKANVAISERMAEAIGVRGVRAESIKVIANWADDRTLKPISTAEGSLRRAWRLEDQFVVGYCGNLGRGHEIETILAAAEALRERGDIAFLFVGEGHHRAELEAAAGSRKLWNVVFKPFQPPELLAEVLSIPDVHWLSLRPELEGLIFPSKFYGIAAVGKPMIAVTGEDGEIAKLVSKHECGVHVAIGDGVGFAEAVAALAADRATRESMGLRSRLMSDQHFSRDQALSKWSDLLAELGA